MNSGAPKYSDAEFLEEIRRLVAEIEANPQKSMSLTLGWYEKTFARDPAKAARGMMLLTVLRNGRGDVPIGDLHARAGKRVVMSLHGLRTRGAWQKQLSSSLSRADFIYEPLDYGFFRAVQLVLPWVRDSKTRWFLDEYTKAAKGSDGPPCVIAHSFGTYLVARTLRKYHEVKFDRVIFCGSIVDVAYPWSSIFESGRVTRVFNDFGGKDFWAKAAEWFVNDAGPSGAKGFEDDAAGRVLKRYRPEFRHSDFFYQANYDSTWVPFLQGRDPDPVQASGRRPPNWKFRLTLSTVLLAIVLLSGYGVHKLGASQNHRPAPVPGEAGGQFPPVPTANDAGLPTVKQAQLAQLKKDYDAVQDRIRRLDAIINDASTTYSYLDPGRLVCYRKDREQQQQFAIAVLAAAQALDSGSALSSLPAMPDLSLDWPNPSASAGYTLWHENQRNNDFTDLYVTVTNGMAGSVELHRPDGTNVILPAGTSLTAELGPSPPFTIQTVGGVQIVVTHRMAFAFPGQVPLAGGTVDIKSPNGEKFATATVGQPTRMSR